MSTAHATPSNPVRDAIGAVLAAKWWAIALRGILAIIFSIIAFTAPGATMLSLVLVFAAYSLADGVFAFLAIGVARQTGMSWLLLALEGLVDIGAAVAAIALPGLTVLVFVFLVGAWAVITGALMLGAGLRLHVDEGRWWLLLGGLTSVIYGVLLFIAPLLGALVLTWWIGAYALVFGVSLLMLAFKLRGLKAR